jgi:hypothetical protein
MIRDTMATQSNKWQQKRMKTDNGKTLNVNHGLIDGTQGANKKVKKSSLDVKNKVFLLVVKNI